MIIPKRKNPIINGKKKCNDCGEIKEITDYYPYRKSIRGSCKKCLNLKNRKYSNNVSTEVKYEWYKRWWANADEEKKNRKYKTARDRIKNIKIKATQYLGGKCRMCGYDKCIEALEFHHIDPTTKDNDMLKGRGIDSRKNFNSLVPELDKCILLCANCHREEHYKLKQIVTEEPKSMLELWEC